MPNDISNTPPAKSTVGKTTNIAPASTGQSNEDVVETLMLLIAQGSGILQKVVQIQEQAAMEMNNDLDAFIKIQNKFNSEIPSGKHEHRISYAVAKYLYDNHMLGGTSGSGKNFRNFVDAIKAYFSPNTVTAGSGKLPKMNKGTADVFKKIFGEKLTDKQTSVKKQSATMSNLSNMVNVKMTLLSSLAENTAAAEGRVIDNFKPKQN